MKLHLALARRHVRRYFRECDRVNAVRDLLRAGWKIVSTSEGPAPMNYQLVIHKR